MKRNWPDFFEKLKHGVDVYNVLSSKHYLQAHFINWLESNIPKEVLDKIAPPICEKHEPFIHDTGSIMYIPNGLTVKSDLIISATCKHCGAEIKPSGWILK